MVDEMGVSLGSVGEAGLWEVVEEGLARMR